MWLLVALLAAGPVPQDGRQLLVAVAPDWDTPAATLHAFERSGPGAAWRPALAPMPVSLGRAGLAWGRGLHAPETAGPQKREGDGRSPAGAFALGVVTGYAREPLAGLRLPYRPATPTLRCVDDPASRHYNALVDEAQVPKAWTSAEDMRRSDELYRWTVWVAHNDAPAQPGAGSCIFLHLRTAAGAVTAGCTALDAPAFERLLAWLDPRARPVLVQLPEAELRRLARPWALPGGGLGAEPEGQSR
jgi:L,D-peptidoglycan transpeptidase YkuD (ErfK/YbiS/YcfS/YnhG family)